MKVILLKEVKGRGGEGDVVEVKSGYANNYLLPQGYALRATKGNLKQLEQRRTNIAKREEVRLAEANELKEKLDGLKFVVDVRIGDEGQLFGAVTAQNIVDSVKLASDVDIDKRRVDIRKAIKTVGLHEVDVVIYRDIKAKLKVVVGGEDPEKFIQQMKNKKRHRNPRKSDVKKQEKKTTNDEVSDKDSKEQVSESNESNE